MHQMYKYAQFERYAKLNWKPVQTLSAGVMCSRVPVPLISLADAFWTRCRGSIDD